MEDSRNNSEDLRLDRTVFSSDSESGAPETSTLKGKIVPATQKEIELREYLEQFRTTDNLTYNQVLEGYVGGQELFSKLAEHFVETEGKNVQDRVLQFANEGHERVVADPYEQPEVEDGGTLGDTTKDGLQDEAPESDGLDDKSKKELVEIAKERGVKSKGLKKDELLGALRAGEEPTTVSAVDPSEQE